MDFGVAGDQLCHLAAAFAGAMPQLFGKQPDGRIRRLCLIALFPHFSYLSGIWHLARLIGRESVANEVVPGLWIGRRPLAGEPPAGINVVMDLTAELVEPQKIREGREYLSIPTLDAGSTNMVAMRDAVEELAPHVGAVYVHCAQGHGRSAALVAAILIRRGIVQTTVEAEAVLKRALPRVGLTRAQREVVRHFESATSNIHSTPV